MKKIVLLAVLTMTAMLGGFWLAAARGANPKKANNPPKAPAATQKAAPDEGDNGSATMPAATGATPKEVDDAIKNMVAEIYSKYKNGNWEAAENVSDISTLKGDQSSGPTGIAVYALLAAGEKVDDPRIISGLHYIEQSKCQGIYAIGLRTQALLLAIEDLKEKKTPEGLRELKAAKAALERDAALLQKGAHPDAKLKEIPSAFYRYQVDSKDIDHSCSQYGVLGVWACVQGEVEIPLKYWQAVDGGWRAIQYPDGAWAYEGSGEVGKNPPVRNGSAAMTCAGIATLFITQEYLHGNDGIDCPGNIKDKNIELGLKWITKNFQEIYDKRPYYALYGVERIGVASGYKYFGTIDWYKQGSSYLKEKNPHLLSDLCFSLLFLVRGRAPVVLNKLQYDIDMHGDTPREGNWNQRPRDAANFVKWVGKQTENQFLNWQIVNLKVPSTDLHDAPILYITGGEQHLDFTDAEIDKLRQYVEDGGLIYANADCGSSPFTTSMEKVCRKLFPDYELGNLPADSPIYHNEQFHKENWHSMFRVETLSNGARELVMIVPTADPSRYWQTQAYGGHEELFQFPDDVFLYAIDKGGGGGLRAKGDTYIVLPDPAIQATQTIKVARLQYGGNWNPEPGSWRRLAAVVHNNDKIDLDVQSVKLGEGKLDNTFKVADLTGTFKFTLPQEARDEINKYVMGGGTLIVDSCGGKADFTQSAQKELAAIFPDNPLPEAPLGTDKPPLSTEPKIEKVAYRGFARNIVGNLHRPRLRAIDINGRTAVFFSGEDMSVGMVGMQIDGIYGYEPDSATALMKKLVLSAGK